MNPYFIAGSLIAVVCAYGAGHWKGDEAVPPIPPDGWCIMIRA